MLFDIRFSDQKIYFLFNPIKVGGSESMHSLGGAFGAPPLEKGQLKEKNFNFNTLLVWVEKNA